MITLAIRLFLILARPDLPADAQHELAHRGCDAAVYGLVDPAVLDDDNADTPLGELLSEALCRNEPLLPGDPRPIGGIDGMPDDDDDDDDHTAIEACEQSITDACVEGASSDGSTDCMDASLFEDCHH